MGFVEMKFVKALKC